MDLFIQEIGAKISREQRHFIISTKEGKKKLAPELVETIIIQNAVSMTTDFIELANEYKIPIYLGNHYGQIYGKIWNFNLDSPAILRRKQLYLFKRDFGKGYAKKWIINKIESQKKHITKILRRKNKDYTQIKNRFDDTIKKIELLDLSQKDFHNILQGYEGDSGRYYYSILREHIPEEWNFIQRVNYMASDPYNVVLNYLFGIIYSKVENALVIAGFDIKIGVLHGESRKGEALLYDFMENFRFIVWETTYTLFTRKLINKSYFEKDGRINYAGKEVMISALFKKIVLEEYGENALNFESWIREEAKILAKEVLEYEIPNFL